ncbi:hypothetical protein Ahy_A07g033185 [Arachis hypogaea]|uniref:Uncharacterized protein n=1 Tax=Arachis hypogaea TaxID=3818 RepID=A0A445C8H0_ARAHY|nr:hypothetical protein Ahy_A07g033185 [Arachis hypogaea]
MKEKNHIKIKIAFWVDARSKVMLFFKSTVGRDIISADLMIFFCFVIFRYNLIFSSFVGINHHGQSTLLR